MRPEYGPCAKCAAWAKALDDYGECRRHPVHCTQPTIGTYASSGCWDFIPRLACPPSERVDGDGHAEE